MTIRQRLAKLTSRENLNRNVRGAIRLPVDDSSASRVLITGPDGTTIQGTVSDLSTDGIGLLVAAPIEPSAILTVSLVNRVGLFLVRLPVRAVRTINLTGGHCLVGATFLSRIPAEDFNALVA